VTDHGHLSAEVQLIGLRSVATGFGCDEESALTSWLISAAHASDADAVSRLYRGSWPGSVNHIAPVSVIEALLQERSEHFWSDSIADLGAGFRLATSDLGLEGFCGWRRDDERTAELEWLFVAPRSQHAGIGSGLHDDALNSMCESHMTDAYLWAVPGNLHGEAFYLRKGWRATQDISSVSTAAGPFPLRRWTRALPLAAFVPRS
jgi:GNAT superfamily N-acetyltransferase